MLMVDAKLLSGFRQDTRHGQRGEGVGGKAGEGDTCDASFSRHSCSSSAAEDGSATARALNTPAACSTGSPCRLSHLFVCM